MLEVHFGAGGMRLFEPDQLAAAQIGYSITSNGQSLIDRRQGSWQPSWLVIGFDTLVGDPIFIDTSSPLLPVFTAMHGGGPWKPMLISPSLEHFFRIYKEFSRISKGRTCPVDLENNPLSVLEQSKFLELTRAAGSLESEFWEIMLEP